MPTTWDDLVGRAVELRRELHRQPELTWQEHETAATIRTRLDALRISWRSCAETGTVATLAGGGTGRHVALRADIDALPITETSGVDWRSQRTGVMHACGHDGHTATLIAAAEWLARHEDALPGPVSLLFQPAEEGGHGAKRMIEDGALDGVDVIFGWHNWPAIPEGLAVCPDGTVMCANGSFAITIDGRGGHASQPELCRDPVLAAAAIVQSLQQIVSRRVAPQEPAVVSAVSILAESAADTVIPDRAVIRGSTRAGSLALRGRLETAIDDIVAAIAAAHGVEARVEHTPRYAATVNHSEPADAIRAALAHELGERWCSHDTAIPIMASEDFSYYLAEIPGAFALIGAGGPEGGVPCHNAGYDFNDRLIPVVARLYARLAGVPVDG